MTGKQFWEEARAQFAEIERAYQESIENDIKLSELISTKKPLDQQQPSAELQKWLDTREMAIEARDKFSNTGGHIMLESSVVNPEELDEPLRTEAIEYLRQRGEWHD